ncbi:hypothetical protein TNCV_3351021 [Trichonephila clavipes]|nr:hypothetical protein TNCV_3351021 [Trichonephila clavipes]
MKPPDVIYVKVGESVSLPCEAEGTPPPNLIWFKKYKKTGSVANIPGRGRKEILSTTVKRKIIHSVKKDPRVSASKLALSMSSTIEEKISDETIRRTLHQYGFHGRTPIRKPLIKITLKKVPVSWDLCQASYSSRTTTPAYSEDCAVILAVPLQEVIAHSSPVSRPKRHRKFVVSIRESCT